MNALRWLWSYLVLPPHVTPFERAYLARMNTVATRFFAAHVPVFALVAWGNDTGTVKAALLSTFVVLGPVLATRVLENPRHAALVYAVAAMALGGLLVHFGQGPMQIEMHFYFFVLIALLAVFANPLVILTAAATVTVHHLLLWLILPSSVFNYEASFWTVAVHALFVVLESVAACFVARSFFDNVIGLERIVESRTAELRVRNEELRLVFDTVGQGFLTLDAGSRILAERSLAVERWLGPATTGEPFAALLGRTDPGASAAFAVGWDALECALLPLELCLDQLPRRIRAGQRTLDIAYTPIGVDEPPSRVLVVISDVTTALACAEGEQEQRDLLAVLDRLQKDELGLYEFLREGDRVVAALGERPGLVESRRLAHTLKGNAAMMGVSRISAACAELEDWMEESRAAPGAAELAGVVGPWTSLRARVGGALGDRPPHRFDVDDRDCEALLQAAAAQAPHAEIATLVSGWTREPLRRRFDRVAEQARSVAKRLGKEGLDVAVQDGGLRLDAADWGPFWGAFVHVVRNAVDHGIETPAERCAAGKPPVGTIRLSGDTGAGVLRLSISDDGQGIDWLAVQACARREGLPADAEHDLRQALLVHGLSTRESVGEFSGRGVGLGAVRASCESLGGAMTLTSERGVGTTVMFVFPAPAVEGGSACAR